MNSSTLIQHSLTGQHYGYSAADLDDLGATEYTLVTIVVDELKCNASSIGAPGVDRTEGRRAL